MWQKFLIFIYISDRRRRYLQEYTVNISDLVSRLALFIRYSLKTFNF